VSITVFAKGNCSLELIEAKLRWVDSIKIDLRQDMVIGTGMIWLRIGTSGGLLRTRE
jgi:hypothetical protein